MSEHDYEPLTDPADYARGDVPPQDNEAERALLGAMILSRDAIEVAVSAIRASDYYRPAHEQIHDVIADMYTVGTPVDLVTLHDELQRRNLAGRVGGALYLHGLIEGSPVAANADYYAKVIRDKALLRALGEAGTKIRQLAHAEDDEADAILDRAQAVMDAAVPRRTAEDYLPIGDVMTEALDAVDALGRGETPDTVPTGFLDLDDLLGGFGPGQMITVAGRPGLGKALALDTPLPTPEGWTTMGGVRVGDVIYGADGRPTQVVAVTDVMHNRPCYRLRFSDGTSIVADAEHQWVTRTRAARKAATGARHKGRPAPASAAPAVVTTEQIAATVRHDARANHLIDNAGPLMAHDATLPIGPYTLGAWLGDGHSHGPRLTSETDEIPALIAAEGYDVEHRGAMLYSIKTPDNIPFGRGVPVCPRCAGRKAHAARLCATCTHDVTFTGRLREAGVLGDKHIPAPYLRASEAQRRELLAGLLDTDGTVDHGGTVSYCSTSERLARDVLELVRTLGYRPLLRTRRVEGRTEASSTAYMVGFTPGDKVFHLTRKAARQVGGDRPTNTCRYIVAAEPVESVPVRCVQVAAPDHLYLAGEAMIPTHNSTLAMDFCRAASMRHNLTSAFFSLEMNRSEIVLRTISAEAKVPLANLRSGRLSDAEWAKIATVAGYVGAAPMFIDDSPHLTMTEIRAKARRLKQTHDLRLIVIDYMQLMSSGRKVESRQQEVSEFSRQIKLLAKELAVPIVALSQLNRGPEQRTSKRPLMSDLRESGSIEQDSDIVVLLHREDAYEKESSRPGEADLLVVKHRNGPTRDIAVAAQLHYSRFADLANY